jgi:acyl-CoA reductase-like NAD-dependent aldehyde dehydrogenase
MPSSSRANGSVAAQTPRAPAPSPKARLDEAVARLRDGAARFGSLSLHERINLLRAMRAGYARIAAVSVEACCRAKRIVLGTPLEAEEWALGPWPVLRHFRLLIEALNALRRGRDMPLGPIGRTVDGRLRIEIFPGSTLDQFLFPSSRAEVHFRAAIGDREVLGTRGSVYRQGAGSASVTLVLPPGTMAGVPVQDTLTVMFNERKVCLLKLHPINSYLGPLLEEAFEPAIGQGFLQIVYGDADEGRYLAHHRGIDEVHLCGRAETYERMLWGEDRPEREERKSHHQPLHVKPLTSHLGCASPVLVVPGPYLDRQLAFQAEALAGAMVHNAGLSCHTPRLLVTPRGWAQRGDFLRHLEQALARAPLRMAYYPGTLEQWQRVTANRRELRTIGAAVGGMLPWTIVPGLDPTSRREPLFTGESFCPVLGEVEVGTADPLEFLQQAVGFVNERLWGTLSATLIVHTRTLSDHLLAAAVERAIAQLRYGAVGVNVWPAQLFAIGAAPWGAHPSSGPAEVQSGRGWTHNTAMLGEIEKVVMRQPVLQQLKPAYAPGHRSADTLLRRLTEVERGAGWAGLPGVLEAALRS